MSVFLVVTKSFALSDLLTNIEKRYTPVCDVVETGLYINFYYH